MRIFLMTMRKPRPRAEIVPPMKDLYWWFQTFQIAKLLSKFLTQPMLSRRENVQYNYLSDNRFIYCHMKKSREIFLLARNNSLHQLFTVT